MYIWRMFESSEAIKRIEAKVKTLAGKLAQLQRENQLLKEENTRLSKQLGEFKAGDSEIRPGAGGKQEEISNSGNANAGRNEDLKKELDQYIEELDACIALLKQW